MVLIGGGVDVAQGDIAAWFSAGETFRLPSDIVGNYDGPGRYVETDTGWQESYPDELSVFFGGARRVENLWGTGVTTRTISLPAGDYWIYPRGGTGSIALSGGASGTVDLAKALQFTSSGTDVTFTVTGTPASVMLETDQGNPSEYIDPAAAVGSTSNGGFVVAAGVAVFPYANGNTVSSGVVTEAQGSALTVGGYRPLTEAITNLMFPSMGDFSAYAFGATGSYEFDTNPFGTQSTKITCNSSTGEHRIANGAIAADTSAIRTFSAIVKPFGSYNVGFRARQTSSTSYVNVVWNGATMALELSGGDWFDVRSIGPLTGGYYLITAKIDTNRGLFSLGMFDGTSNSFTGDGASGFWCAYADARDDIEWLDDPIETVSASVTRAAETHSLAIAAASLATFTLLYEITVPADGWPTTTALLGSDDGDILTVSSDGSLLLDGTDTTVNLPTTGGQNFRLALSHDGTDAIISVDGGAATTTAATVTLANTLLRLAHSNDGSNAHRGDVHEALVLTTALSSADVVAWADGTIPPPSSAPTIIQEASGFADGNGDASATVTATAAGQHILYLGSAISLAGAPSNSAGLTYNSLFQGSLTIAGYYTTTGAGAVTVTNNDTSSGNKNNSNALHLVLFEGDPPQIVTSPTDLSSATTVTWSGTTTAIDSAVYWFAHDSSGATPVFTATTDNSKVYENSSGFAAHVFGKRNNTGAAGAYTLGFTAANAGTFQYAAIEMFAPAASSTGAITAAASGTFGISGRVRFLTAAAIPAFASTAFANKASLAESIAAAHQAGTISSASAFQFAAITLAGSGATTAGGIASGSESIGVAGVASTATMGRLGAFDQVSIISTGSVAASGGGSSLIAAAAVFAGAGSIQSSTASVLRSGVIVPASGGAVTFDQAKTIEAASIGLTSGSTSTARSGIANTATVAGSGAASASARADRVAAVPVDGSAAVTGSTAGANAISLTIAGQSGTALSSRVTLFDNTAITVQADLSGGAVSQRAASATVAGAADQTTASAGQGGASASIGGQSGLSSSEIGQRQASASIAGQPDQSAGVAGQGTASAIIGATPGTGSNATGQKSAAATMAATTGAVSDAALTIAVPVSISMTGGTQAAQIGTVTASATMTITAAIAADDRAAIGEAITAATDALAQFIAAQFGELQLIDIIEILARRSLHVDLQGQRSLTVSIEADRELFLSIPATIDQTET